MVYQKYYYQPRQPESSAPLEQRSSYTMTLGQMASLLTPLVVTLAIVLIRLS